jgi:hypothetical protein
MSKCTLHLAIGADGYERTAKSQKEQVIYVA